MATQRVDVLVRGGNLASGQGSTRADLAVRDGRFVAIEAGVSVEAGRMIDASGKLVVPGVIDSHVHPVYDDDVEATSRTAALHGVTTMIAFVGAVAAWGGSGTLTDAIKRFIDDSERSSHIDFGIHGTITASDEPIPQLRGLIDLGVPSFKCFMAYVKRGMMLSDDRILPFWTALGEAGGLAMVHAENGPIIDALEDRLIAAGELGNDAFLRTHPPLEEAEAVVRAVALAQTAQCPLYIVHLAVKEGAQFLATIKAGLVHPLYVETCPHYLLLTNQAVLDTGPLAKIGPPIRERSDNEALWGGLASGLIDTIGTDHAAYTIENKTSCTHILDAKYGGPGIGSLLPLIYSEGVRKGRISLERMVQALSENPARIFGLRSKGHLTPGYDADLVIIDPYQEHVVRAAEQGGNCDYSMYEGWRCAGTPVLTMQRGKVLSENGRLMSAAGDGRFVPGRLG